MNRVAKMIQDARRKAGLSEKELAKKAGVSASYIMQIESGKKIINEQIADKMLKILGESTVTMVSDKKEEEKEIETTKAKPALTHTKVVTPNAQWADALSGVIKNYPVYDGQMKIVKENRELPILSKKVEGHHPDKITFMEAPSSELESLRIKKGDILTLVNVREIQNGKVHVYERNGVKHLAVMRKVGNKKISVKNDAIGKESVLIDEKSLKIIGQCIKVEIKL